MKFPLVSACKSMKFIILFFIVSTSAFCQMNDTGWDTLYHENFDSNFTAIDGEKFGTDNWLIFQLLNNGSIIIENGYAQLNAPDFWNAALIRSTHILPAEYKLRTKIGYINYDLTNYEQDDYDHSDFNSHSGFYENGMYFLTVTNDTCIANECAEQWWHYHRKMVIDIDNHLGSGGVETFHPIYMVYMGHQYTSVGNVLRTWDGSSWDESTWNWHVAATYEYDSWYYAELEKINNSITLRLYDGDKVIMEQTSSVPLDKVFAMDDSTEFLYLGEPHTDDYEGNVRIDEITLMIPSQGCCQVPGDADNDGEIGIVDLTFFVNYIFGESNLPPICMEEFDNDGNCESDISDLTYFIEFMFNHGSPPVDCHLCK